jgi:hypothetical protein
MKPELKTGAFAQMDPTSRLPPAEDMQQRRDGLLSHNLDFTLLQRTSATRGLASLRTIGWATMFANVRSPSLEAGSSGNEYRLIRSVTRVCSSIGK